MTQIKTKQELMDEIESMKNLARAVEVKDEEIIRLKKELEGLKLSFTSDKASEIAKIKDSQDKVKASMQYELEELRARVGNQPDIEKLLENNKKLVKFVDGYVKAVQNHLKAEQATLDNTIELQALLLDILK